MRLVQKRTEQTGIAIIQVEGIQKFVPLFSKDPLSEANQLVALRENFSLLGVYVTLGRGELIKLIEEADKFRKEYGYLPRNLMDQIRTGFAEGSGLRQISDKYAYK